MKKLLIITTLSFFSLLLVGCSDEPEYQKTAGDYQEVDSCYQIFPIAYSDGNGDGMGDLEGIMDKADYLTDTLDVDCVWLTPVNESPSYHKYDVVDYYSIDEQFGDEETYEEFLDTMEENDIKVLMDFVINHTSYQHPWFEDARSDEDSEYRDYYVWSDEEALDEDYNSKEGWVAHGDEYYFASFWDQMPELNYENEDVREEIKEIASYWLDKGVDGFRIDAARHIYDRNEFPSSMDT
ncbi:MAG: alpha-amylase family glycosyl hydrolase, partial [Bacillota bacterium]